MDMNKTEMVIDAKEGFKIIATDLSGALLETAMNKINPKLREHISEVNISALAVNPVRDPKTEQISADQLKIGINLRFK